LTGWPAWAEAGEALRATLGDAGGGANCAAEMGFSLAVSASTTRPNTTGVRSERKRIGIHPLSQWSITWSWKPAMSPTLAQGLRNYTTP